MKSVFESTLKSETLKILLVVDDLGVTELSPEIGLEAKGVRVSLTRVKRSEAIEALEREDFDGILLELSFANNTWLDTITTLTDSPWHGNRQTCPPIVVIGAIDNEEFAIQALNAGAQDYLVKGKIENEQVIRSLRYAIVRQRRQDALRQNQQNCCSAVTCVTQMSFQSVYERLDTWLDAVHPEDRQQIINSWERLLRGETVESEYRVIRPDGSMVWVLDRTFPVWNSQGEIYRLAGIALDISDAYRQATQRKQQEKALQQQKEILQTIFDHIPVMVALHDANGQIQLINRELERVLGWSLAELGSRDLLTFCYPNPKSRQRVMKHLLAATGEWQDFKTRTRDGCVLDISWAGIRLSDGTNISIGQDVTKRKRTEEVLRSLTQQQRVKALQLEQALTELQHTQAQLVQNEKMASLGQLVAGVAHEINNPTSFIYCNIPPALEYTSNLLRLIALYQQHYPAPPPKIQAEIDAIDLDFIKQDFPKLLNSMHEGASRIQGIVKSLRNFSHIDATQPKTTDLHQGLDNTLMILRTRLKEQPHRVAIQVIKQYGDLPLVECYPGELNQVLMNILGNAIDAIEQKIKEEANFTPQIRICTEVVRVSEQTTQMQHSTCANQIQTFLTQPQIQSISWNGRTLREPTPQHLKSQLDCTDKVVIISTIAQYFFIQSLDLLE
ncbi:MAG: hypothetical protein Fur006_18530 [Coleofasciculaceae cyanobacterium]